VSELASNRVFDLEGVYDPAYPPPEAFAEAVARKYRIEDNRCGPGHSAPGATVAECDPYSLNATYGPCCSSAGYCTADAASCACDACVDYSRVAQTLLVPPQPGASVKLPVFPTETVNTITSTTAEGTATTDVTTITVTTAGYPWLCDESGSWEGMVPVYYGEVATFDRMFWIFPFFLRAFFVFMSPVCL
jgi:hypothetical protein